MTDANTPQLSPTSEYMGRSELYFRNAPIIEAIADIRMEFLGTINTEQEESYIDILRDEYPEVSPYIAHTVTFNPASSNAPAYSNEKQALRLYNPETRCSVFVGHQGFAFSQASRYTKWSDFQEKIERAWKPFIDIFQPSAFKRTALRYVNLFHFQDESISLPRFFTIYPQADALNYKYSQHAMSFKIKYNDQIDAVVQQQQLPSASEIQILLDLDVFQENETFKSPDEVWQALDGLRDAKDRIFCQCLTYEGQERIS